MVPDQERPERVPALRRDEGVRDEGLNAAASVGRLEFAPIASLPVLIALGAQALSRCAVRKEGAQDARVGLSKE